jgi:urease accessory protein
MEPFKSNVRAMGQMEGYTHQSTLLFISDNVDVKAICEKSKDFLSCNADISFGASLLPVNGLIFRMLGYGAEKLFECNLKLAAMIRLKEIPDKTHLPEKKS